jgi:uncharacterized ferredoxin-like protein
VKRRRSSMFAGPEESKKMAYESLLDVATHVIHAVRHAPQITGRLEVKTAIVTGEDLLPLIEFLELVGEDHELVPWMDHMTYRKAYDEGKPPVVVLMGADLTKSASGWNCGACGFTTCAEFNKHSKLTHGLGLQCYGPSCMLNVLDMGIACDQACAAASKYDIENRIHTTVGLSALHLEYLEDVSYILGLSLGPLEEFWYYNRPCFTDIWDTEFHHSIMDNLRTLFPIMFQSFTGSWHPAIKSYDKWWDAMEQDFVSVTQDKELNEVADNLLPKVMAAAPELRKRVKEIKARGAGKKDD